MVFRIQYCSKIWYDLRKKSLKNEYEPGCKNCYFHEESGSGSRRIWANTTFPHTMGKNKITSMELKLGAKCNLACRSCSSLSSNKLLKEDSMLRFGEINKQWMRNLQSYSDWTQDPKFWDELKSISHDMEYIQFTGGEPLLIQEHYDYLKWLGENNVDAAIQYITNATIGVDDYKKSLWDKFTKLVVDFSIDAVGELGEYMRTGSVWEEQVRNIKSFMDYREERMSNNKILELNFSVTVGILNVHRMHELYEWIYDMGLGDIVNISINLVRFPEWMDVSQLNDEAKDIARKELNRIKSSNRYSEFHKGKVNVVLNKLDETPETKQSVLQRLRFKEKTYNSVNKVPISYKDIMPEWWNKLSDN